MLSTKSITFRKVKNKLRIFASEQDCGAYLRHCNVKNALAKLNMTLITSATADELVKEEIEQVD